MKHKYLLIFLLSEILFFFFMSEWSYAQKLVTDQVGRRITLPDNPQRLVALAPSITEIIFAIGQGHRLKGVTRFSDFPPEAAKLPQIGSFMNPELEKILALKPDLCIGIRGGNPKLLIERLESLNIPVYVVDPGNLNDVIENILSIGHLLNADENAASVADNMHSRIRRIKQRTSATAYFPRVFFQIGISPIVSAGTDTFIHELITLAGGKNLAQGEMQYPRFNREQVLALAPDIFIITSMARGEMFEQVKTDWLRWTEMPAAKHNRIFIVDSNLFDRPGPRLAQGLELLYELIHPAGEK